MARNKTPTLSVIGERVDLEVRQGSTLTFDQAFVLADETPFDLTGCQVRAYIRKTMLAPTIIERFEVTISDALNGLLNYTLTDEQTGAMTAGATIGAAASRYVWDAELELPDGTVSPLFYGEFRLQPEVTREQDEPTI